MGELRIHQAAVRSDAPQIRIHDAVVRVAPAPPPGHELRIHSATVEITPVRPLGQLLVHRAWLAVGPSPVTPGGWWVRVAGVWVRCRAWVRFGDKWT